MEVFVRNLPPRASEKSLKREFKPYLERLSISDYSCQKKGKFATLTFLAAKDAHTFLRMHSQITMLSVIVQCTASRNKPDSIELRSLEMAKKQRSNVRQDAKTKPEKRPREFSCTSVSCGIWSYNGHDLVFVPYQEWKMTKVKFGSRSLIVSNDLNQIHMPFSGIHMLTVGGDPTPSLTVTGLYAPHFREANVMETLTRKFQGLLSKKTKNIPHIRLPCLDKSQGELAQSCLVYRINVSSTYFNEHMREQKNDREMPETVFHQTHIQLPKESLSAEFSKLAKRFVSPREPLPFPIMFQLQRLAQNGILSPSTVLGLIPDVAEMAKRSGTAISVSALRKLAQQIPFAGPETEASNLQVTALVQLLRESEDRSKRESDYSKNTDSSNVADVYRAMVTPAGIYLDGPDPETKNRVLRKYSEHIDYFLRVQFCDEDGQQVRYNPQVSNDLIFYSRFKSVLNNGFNIAGRQYGFLGFSHSSLRSQSCWFMAPFTYQGTLHLYQKVIRDLGDFSKIHCPAKCAARIGQAFSDTPNAIPLGSVEVVDIPDVTRNGRVFSDGVGTFSPSVLKQIWDALPKKHLVKPTVFQIRHSGAKGVISLDSRLKKHILQLRPSMIKFSGSDSTDIELCGAAYRPLPMFLNRQIIKIFEDLGVEHEFFMDIQAQAVESLRKATLSSANAAEFLAAHNVGGPVHLSWFIKQLDSLNLSFQADRFLRDVVHTAVLLELRALKHRSRIPVKEGFTLFGIMDETGILEEGEVFIIVDSESGVPSVLHGERIVVTRCPALHPGDVQIVRAVNNIPQNSPLRKLSNCICFSQKGSRDLPSKLSGGDLDGDLYQIVYDPRAIPKRTEEPADYPRQDPINIGRSVERHDITDFFVQFMATDQLGRIATSHQILADHRKDGTLDPDCIVLASMHSTAVDFSKTGIPVDLSLMPKFPQIRPDFMAPGPHVIIEKKEDIRFDETEGKYVDEDDSQEHRYYESDKILGKLYRDIDEREVFRDIQQKSMLSDNTLGMSVLDSIWEFVKRRCQTLYWKKYLDTARNIRDFYDDCIYNIMTEYSEHPRRPLSETEVFVGNILGKTGAQSKQQRELSTTMKERFSEVVTFVIHNIVRDGAEPSLEALERSIACFEVSFEIGRNRSLDGGLVSFKYVAAAVCLKEIDRCSAGRLRSP